eukprot:m.24448 g.24448  ORF g.24448 m.24448 type:complete len:502 (-) comp8692_c0_seq1:87-1592(-)
MALLARLAVLSLALACATAGDVFASSSNVHRLFNMERGLSSQIKDFIGEQRHLLSALEGLASEIERQRPPPSDLQLAPGEAFSAIKRVKESFEKLGSLMKQYHGAKFHEYLQAMNASSPDRSDLEGAAASLLRLQRTYEQPVEQLFPRGSAEEYFLVGKKAYMQADFVSAIEWLSAALTQLERANSTAASEMSMRTQILDYLAFCAYRTDNLEAAAKYSAALLELDPSNSRVSDNLIYYRKAAASRAAPKAKVTRNYTEDNLLKHDDDEMADFRALCRGEPMYVPPTPLVCELVTYNNPALLLQPARIERMHWGNEELSVLRDFATVKECEQLIEIGRNRLQRAVAYTGDGFAPVNFRISTVAWLPEDTDELVARLNRRINRWTNLDLEHAEQLQVSNYGIGGHYEPHYDHHGDPRRAGPTGDRLSTFMLYLSNVEAGGSTAFPRLGAAVTPSRGDAAWWFNLHEDGESNQETLHGACPVLRGSKWVANKWIHEKGNVDYM